MHSSAARFQRHPSPSSSKICSGELVPLYTQHRAPLTFRAYQIGPIVREREGKGERERERERETERNAISFTSPSRTHHRYNSVDDYDKLLDRFVGSKPRFTREQHENVYIYVCISKSAYDGDDSRKGGLGRFHWKISRDSRHTEAVSGDEHESRRPRGGRVGRDTTRRSLRRILRAFVCVPGHVCLRENACFSRVTWPLRLAHKGQKRPEAIVRASRPHRDWLATAYAKESSSVEGSLWHGTPWGTGALVPWTKHLPASPPRNTPYRTSPSSSSASLLSVASRVYTLLFSFFFVLFSFFFFLFPFFPPPSSFPFNTLFFLHGYAAPRCVSRCSRLTLLNRRSARKW